MQVTYFTYPDMSGYAIGINCFSSDNTEFPCKEKPFNEIYKGLKQKLIATGNKPIAIPDEWIRRDWNEIFGIHNRHPFTIVRPEQQFTKWCSEQGMFVMFETDTQYWTIYLKSIPSPAIK